jgi:transposase
MTELKRRQYTAEFKKEAVELVTNHGYSITKAAKNLGINSSILARWRREQLKKQQNAFPGTGHQPPETEELNRLREEIRRLKLEREILKKAAVFFAKESG